MKASVLCIYNEGSQPNTPYIGAKGFSVMIDVDGERTLFGTGLRGRYLIHNMEHLGIGADSISRVVVSHGHADHARAISALLDARSGPVPIYAPTEAWGGRGPLSKDGISFTKRTESKAERKDVTGWTQISKHLFLTPPTEADGTSETFMVLAGGNRPILISGCCHCGIDPVLETVREKFGDYPRALIGGLHLEKAPKEIAYATAEKLRDTECQELYLNHCTGPKGALRIREKLSLYGVKEYNVGDKLEYELGLI